MSLSLQQFTLTSFLPLCVQSGCGDRPISTDNCPLLTGCQRAAAFISGEFSRPCHSLLLPADKVSLQKKSSLIFSHLNTMTGSKSAKLFGQISSESDL